MPTRDECRGRRLRMCDPSEDFDPTPLYPLRYRLGFLVALCNPEVDENGKFIELSSNESLLALHDRRFNEARIKAIDKFVKEFKPRTPAERETIERVVLEAEKQFLLDFIALADAVAATNSHPTQTTVDLNNMFEVRVILQGPPESG